MKKKHIEICANSQQGKRDYNEDRTVSFSHGSIYMFGVFDGHGSDAVAKVLPNAFKTITKQMTSSLFKNEARFRAFLRTSVIALDEWLLKKLGKKAEESGSTACLGFYDTQTQLFYSMNLGDSRGVFVAVDKEAPNLKTTEVQVTADHKPGDAKEKRRIERAGGRVHSKNSSSSVARVAGILAISRVFGDWELKSPINGARGHWAGNEPDILGPYYLDTDRDDYFLFFGSDGVFDVLKNNELKLLAVRQVSGSKVNAVPFTKLCKYVVDLAIDRWKRLPKGVGDNTSLVVVRIN
jgi:serine/threonine protein phosphatase PrpC